VHLCTGLYEENQLHAISITSSLFGEKPRPQLSCVLNWVSCKLTSKVFIWNTR